MLLIDFRQSVAAMTWLEAAEVCSSELYTRLDVYYNYHDITKGDYYKHA